MIPKLPNLNDLNVNQGEQDKNKIKKEIIVEKEDRVDVGTPSKPKMPKSTYDSDGNPILTVPNLDDVNLTGEIDKYFG